MFEEVIRHPNDISFPRIKETVERISLAARRHFLLQCGNVRH